MQHQDIHVFQGLKRDNNPINQEAKFLWNALNVRLTSRDDNTLLSLTNEKGTLDTSIIFEGNYVGHSIIGDYIIVFTNEVGLHNWIYRIENKEGKWYNTILYYDKNNTLNFDTEAGGFQSLSVYEGDLVQKVYWVDGKNSPRVINVVQDKLKEITDLPSTLNNSISNYTTYDFNKIYPKGFDFIPTLDLNENITITKEYGVGSFLSGTIQYAFTYYNKYDRESNIFYVTPLYYISHKDRGGSPEDNIANVFKGKIIGVDKNFDYIRVYSIHRTSLNATPTVKVVIDLKTSDYINTTIPLTFIDNGTTGSNVDPTQLLYIGGEDIIASSIEEKDNTLFLGNIKIKRPQINDLKENIKNGCTLKDSQRELTLSYEENSSFYNYSNELNGEDPSYFRANENYRLGVQFQHKSGKWSEPVFLKDYVVGNNHPSLYNNQLYLNSIQCILDKDSIENLKNKGYKKVRPLVVLPTIYDKRVIAQGILNPTVYSVKDRLNKAPFAQSSWFFRPMMLDTSNYNNNSNGAVVAYKPYEALLGSDNAGSEIQNMDTLSLKATNDSAINNDKVANTFYVDQSILTFHSPDIEFNDSLQLNIDNEDFELKIVGIVPFKYSASDIDITTKTAAPAPSDTGFYHTTFFNKENNKIMASGLFYRSHAIDSSGNSDRYVYAPGGKDTANNYELEWMVYPWHRTGAINNDVNRPENCGSRTTELKRKVISNIRYSENNEWKDLWSSNDITSLSIFNSNEMSLIKLPIPKGSTLDNLNYYGNVDTLITTQRYYNFYYSIDGNTIHNIKDNGNTDIGVNFTDGDKGLYQSKEPVRMKYKSSPHAVFSLNYKDGSSVVLPYLKINNGTINKSPLLSYTDINKFFWDNTIIEDTPTGDAKTVSIVHATTNDNYTYLTTNHTPTSNDTNKLAVMTTTEGYDELWIVRNKNLVSGSTWYWDKIVSSENTYYKYTEGDNTIYWKTVRDSDGTFIIKRMITSREALVTQDCIDLTSQDIINKDNYLHSILYLAELRRVKNNDNLFGGTTEEALKANNWIPAGNAVSLDTTIEFTHGDTYYQRYDCLKTYPFTTEDINSIVDIASFMVETNVNIDGRYDRNRGQFSNLNMSPTNFNLINQVYSQKDNFFNYRILDNDYYRTINYPSQVIWSLEKTNLEDIDKWTNITLANSYDLSGSEGKLVSLAKFNNTLLAFQENSVNELLFNSRVQIPTSDGVPIEISNSYKMEGARTISNTIGCQDLNAITLSPLGIYFIDSNSNTLYLFNGQLNALSDNLGFKWFLRENHSNSIWNFVKNTGIRLDYDYINKDLYLCSSVGNALCYSEILGHCTSLMSYGDAILFPFKDKYMSLALNNKDNLSLWENFKGDYNSFYGNTIMPEFTYICNDNPTITKIFDTIEYTSDIYDKDGELQTFKSFDWIESYNEYQDTGKKKLEQKRVLTLGNNLNVGKNSKKKFRIWRALVPREGRQRMRNPWTAITLGFNKKDTDEDFFKLILHNIKTGYTV